jgi:hypothetical protein
MECIAEYAPDFRQRTRTSSAKCAQSLPPVSVYSGPALAIFPYQYRGLLNDYAGEHALRADRNPQRNQDSSVGLDVVNTAKIRPADKVINLMNRRVNYLFSPVAQKFLNKLKVMR